MSDAQRPADELSPLQKAYGAISLLKRKVQQLEAGADQTIAVVGMACKAPMANNTDELWTLLREQRDAIREIPSQRFDIDEFYDPRPGQPGKTYVRQGGFLDDIDAFDAPFFGISAREAEAMDPQQRLLLQVGWHSLEHAGIVPSTLKGSATGVFVGVTATDYGYLQADSNEQTEVNPYFNTGVPLNGCAGRISYLLGLQGPCITVDTACSSSLTAIHLACQSLRARECDLALAGGVNVTLTPLLYVTLSAAGMVSPDGHCKTFDESANGYARGEGCGLIVLKRLEDARRDGDHILGLIRGTGINQDGASSGFTVPSGPAQQQLMAQTLKRSGVMPQEIDYVEAHGTGTPLGDPIEINSIGKVLGLVSQREQPIRVGSIKTNVGHLESAAGVMGVIKVLLALQNEALPATLHLKSRNTNIDWDSLRVEPVVQHTPWPRTEGAKRLAAVNSFGASGSNAHIIIEEGPVAKNPQAIESGASRPCPILPLSTRSIESLRKLASSYEAMLATLTPESLSDLANTTATRREVFGLRAAVLCENVDTAKAALHSLATQQGHESLVNTPATTTALNRTRVAFLYTGQGGVYSGMAKDVYEQFDVYRDAINQCAELLGNSLGADLRKILGYHLTETDEPEINLSESARLAQPALFCVQYGLTKLWQSLGIEPSAVLGHSLGEFAAACAAGIIPVADALKLVCARGRLMDDLPIAGGMLAVRADASTIKAALISSEATDHVDIAVLNSRTNTVLAGSQAYLTACQSVLTREGIQCRALSVTHGFHSALMDPMLDSLEKAAQDVKYEAAQIAYVSGLRGRSLTADEHLDARYWRDHCRQPVQFSQALATLLEQGVTHFIEIGPGRVLSNVGSQAQSSANWIPSLGSTTQESLSFTRAVANAFVSGLPIKWSGYYGASTRTDLPLPHYPFESHRYWLKPAVASQQVLTPTNSSPINSAGVTMTTEHATQVKQVTLSKLLELFAGLLRLPAETINPKAQLVEMGADSLVLVSGVNAIENEFGVKLEIRQFFEEITTLEAIADHLAKFAPAPTDLGTLTSTVIPPAIKAQMPAPQATAASQAAITSMPVLQLQATASTDTLSQLILAQTQLMAQHMALLSGGQVNPMPTSTAALSAPSPSMATTPPAAPAVNPTQPGKPAGDDRSSPLKALNSPITAGPSGLEPKQQNHLDALIKRYQQRTQKSKELAQDCRAQLADSRASVGFRFSTKEILYPITGVQSTGSHIIDVDGNDYVDLTMGFGVLLFGSKPDHMKGVIEDELANGFQLGPRTDRMHEIADLFCEMSGHDRVGFTNSGTEAVMIALRLARAATGRDKIVIFEGAYNGHSDATLAKTVRGPSGELHSEPVAPGIPKNVAKDCLVLEYGSPATLEIIRAHAHELGAVLVEPVQSRNLTLQPVEFLRSLRELTKELDIALIFDEMISGFRAHQGGVQKLWGIKADLATYGKIIGGGTAIGAVAGSSRFMDGIDGGMWQYGDASYPTARRTYFGGTFCQHPISMAGCLATLRELKRQGPELQERLNARTAAFAKTLNDFFIEEQIELRIVYFASTFGFRFPGNLEVFFYHLLEKGVYIWEWRACFLSTAHTDEDLERVIQAVKQTVHEMRDGGFLPPKSSPPQSGRTLSDPTNAANGSTTSVTSHHADSASASTHNRPVNFGLYFFGNYDAAFSASKYELLMQGSRYADEHGFDSIWLPERHFDKFGGFSPNPSVLAAALARETSHISIRAGSVVMPLHHPLRVAEEWALVDNLSNGRVGIAFASGWHPNDFALAPDNFSRNRELTFEGVQTVRQLWSGETVDFKGGDNKTVGLSVYPRPKQSTLPTWLTVVANPDTYRKAGEMGMGILTNLLGQSLDDLAKNIQIYLQALREHGHDASNPKIAVLVHTFLQKDASDAIEVAREPMCNYLLSSLSLFQKMAESLPPHLRDVDRASESDKTYIVSKAYERYVAERALIGSPESCRPMVDRLLSMGVTEIACFVDFGVAAKDVLASLPLVNELKTHYQKCAEVKSNQFSLTEAQRHLWLIAQMDQDGLNAYQDPGHATIRGQLDVRRLNQALTDIVARHESLRTTISKDGLTQIIHPAGAVAVTVVDLSEQSDASRAGEQWIKEQVRKPIDLETGPLFTPYLLRLAPEHHILTLMAHHIISDGPSMGTIIRELMQLLDDQSADHLPVAMQYRQFADWQDTQFKNASLKAHENYWLQQFSQQPEDLSLPLDKLRPPLRTWSGERLRLECPADTAKTIATIASQYGCTAYMVLFAAYSSLIHRLSEQSRVVIGAPFSGRGLSQSNSMVGYGIHLLPIITECSAETSLSSHLANIKQSLLEAYRHQDYPFAWLMNQLPLKRDPAKPALVSTIFNFEKLPSEHQIGGLTVSPYLGPVAYSRVDLTFTVNQIGQNIVLEADYNTDLFESETIERFMRSYLTLLDAMQTQPDNLLSRVPLLSSTDHMEVLENWNQVDAEQTTTPIHRIIEENALRQATAIAVRDSEDLASKLSFEELNQRANQLAHYLISKGIGADQRVGVCLNRKPELLVALLACLKAGAAYVPMDPSYPAERLNYLQTDASVSMLLSTSKIVQETQLNCSSVCLLDKDAKSISAQNTQNISTTPLPDQLAYVIYTSGSTGKPKGAMMTHGGLSNYVQWAVKAYEADQGDGSPVLGSIGFDATITSLFVPLAAGKPVVLLPEGDQLQALQALAQTKDQYSFIKITPAHLEVLNSLRQHQKQPNKKLAKYLVLGGEALPAAYLDPWFEVTKTLGVNEYGPTETVVGCCTYTAQQPSTGSVPIGRAIAGTRLYVLDSNLNAVVPGTPGELYIGGAGVARGYLNRPGQTASVFVPDPFAGIHGPRGARLYKTGDLVKAQADGTLIFLGRIDSQIKLNGFRIEPGEIEAALTDLPSVREAVVIKRQDEPGQSMLVAYVTANKGASPEESGLIASLRQRLPNHMIPSRVIVLDAMPLTTHGKVDRAKLPAPRQLSDDSSKQRGATIALAGVGSGNTEQAIHQVWCDVLNRENIAADSSFFDLGGNSLLLLEVHRRLEPHLPKGLQVIELFRYPTIGALAKFLQDRQHAAATDDVRVDMRVAKQLAARQRQTASQRRARS